jgi:hypothetical protein
MASHPVSTLRSGPFLHGFIFGDNSTIKGDESSFFSASKSHLNRTSIENNEQIYRALQNIAHPFRYGRYDNPILTRFLAPMDCSKIPAKAT